MTVSLEMPPRKYPSLGRCIFCLQVFPPEELTEEHIILRAISGIGEVAIDKGSCTQCNSAMNARFEQAALAADLKVPRILLGLKRRRKGAKQRPLELPPVARGDFVKGGGEFDEILDNNSYPSLINLLMFEPAGMLSGIARGSNLKNPRICLFNLGPKKHQASDATMREGHNHSAFALTLAKMAYTFAVAELGFDAFDGSEIIDLLYSKREDIYNFVGGLSENEHFANRHLHALYLRRRGDLLTVVVHLFASCRMLPYEVVVGRWR